MLLCILKRATTAPWYELYGKQFRRNLGLIDFNASSSSKSNPSEGLPPSPHIVPILRTQVLVPIVMPGFVSHVISDSQRPSALLPNRLTQLIGFGLACDEPPNGTSAESPFVSLFDEAFEDIESPFVYATGMAFDQLNSAVPHAQELQGLKERIRIQTEGIEKLTAEHGKVKEERRKLDIHLQEVLDSNDESLKRVDMLVQAGVTLPRWVMELAEELRNDKVQLQAELNAAYGKESDTDAVRQGELAAAGILPGLHSAFRRRMRKGSGEQSRCACTGRLLEFPIEGYMNSSKLKYLIIDEADRITNDFGHRISEFQANATFKIIAFSATSNSASEPRLPLAERRSDDSVGHCQELRGARSPALVSAAAVGVAWRQLTCSSSILLARVILGSRSSTAAVLEICRLVRDNKVVEMNGSQGMFITFPPGGDGGSAGSQGEGAAKQDDYVSSGVAATETADRNSIIGQVA
ncbi:uncharacterized protein MYCGRDRAFT_111740 [Zymoseptoria tritici IPO323]|uniref:Helicase ATP-binding domain-containing protein n=1 Tax=Zymoseptoria tritici (strain CBS 115943 / IPO323) TaxID=336722 RepID=F9XQT3_ZYMTI|nr:uncharacterized protein MYCGRDRAFT_111740 [Zymoseptoria tritici IPO323]EGP82412.1 hypothetical protein MYCGRDRAFT_111740 [Zymoseptoria tritici IPO323]